MREGYLNTCARRVAKYNASPPGRGRVDDPLDGIAERIRSVVTRTDSREPSDLDGNAIKTEQFLPITDGKPAKMAFVDGGNAVVDESVDFIASLNRVCFTMYEGERKIEPKGESSAEFFSLAEFSERDGKTFSETRLFRQSGDARWLPDEDDLSMVVPSSDQRDRAPYLPRKFAERRLAHGVAVDELDEGDMLVIDGSLQTGAAGETKYAYELYDMAVSKNIILCGLSKTSTVMTRAGHPLLPPIRRVGCESNHSKWFVPVGAQKGGGDDRWRSLVVRLHEDSDYVFRLDMLDAQYSEETAGRVAASLAANSRDASIPGYPYGAVEADGIARVRQSQARAAKYSIQAALMTGPEWGAYERNAQAIDMHERLNSVA